MNIVERIKELCKINKISIKSLEKELNIGNGSIAKWTKSTPSVENVIKLSKKFNVTLDWLVTGKEEKDLTQDEKKLIELYRNTNDTGQPLTMKHARDIQQALPRTGQEQKQKSSDSKIG